MIHDGSADVGFNTKQQIAKIKESFEKHKANDSYHMDASLSRKGVVFH